MKNVSSQRKAILSFLKNGNTLTAVQAYDLCGTMKLATRVSELIDQGYGIQKEWITTQSGKRVMKYSLPHYCPKGNKYIKQDMCGEHYGIMFDDAEIVEDIER